VLTNSHLKTRLSLIFKYKIKIYIMIATTASSTLRALMRLTKLIALALLTFPIAIVAHLVAMCVLPFEIFKATLSEIFYSSSHRHLLLRKKTKKKKKKKSERTSKNDDKDEVEEEYASDLDDIGEQFQQQRAITISNAFSYICNNGFTIKALLSSFHSNKDEQKSLHYFHEKHKTVVEALKFQVEDADERFKASVQKIRESEIQRVKLNEKLQETARQLARASGKDVRVSQSSKTHYGGSKREYDDRTSGSSSSSSAEMFATGCLCAYYLYCFYDVEDPFKFDRKMATLVPLFWVACLAVNSNGINKLATVANLILTGYFGALVYTNQRMLQTASGGGGM
jgi:hypothetical protein